MPMNQMRKNLIELLDIYAPSGEETLVREYLQPILYELMDEVQVDSYGNLLAVKKVGHGGSTIMLSAHMDTVKGVKPNKKVVEKSGIFMAELPDGSRTILGADDRAGIAIILTALRSIPESFNGVIKVAFTRNEEVGLLGANRIDTSFYFDVALAIVVDRQGNRDIVVGCDNAFCSNNVGIFMENVSKRAGMDYKCVEGGESDAIVFSSYNINSVNLSAGYQNEHTSNEFVSIFNMKDTVKLIGQTLEIVNDFYKGFGEVPFYNKWVKEYTEIDDMFWEEESDENGDVYVYGVDGYIVIKQGDSELRMSPDNFINLSKRIIESLDKS